MSVTGIPTPGQMVLVRRRPAVVRDVVAYGNGNPAGVLHLTGSAGPEPPAGAGVPGAGQAERTASGAWNLIVPDR